MMRPSSLRCTGTTCLAGYCFLQSEVSIYTRQGESAGQGMWGISQRRVDMGNV